MSPVRLALSTSIAAATVVLATTGPALAFHHATLLADTCGQSDFAGGANPTAETAIREHNPAQTLPLPPVGFDHAQVDRGSCPALQERSPARPVTSGFSPDGSRSILRVVNILTTVTADVEQSKAEELIAAYEALLADGLPDGLLETKLLGDGNGHWAIQSLWRDRAALDAMRAAPEPPAAPALFRRFSGDPTLTIMSVLVDGRADR